MKRDRRGRFLPAGPDSSGAASDSPPGAVKWDAGARARRARPDADADAGTSGAARPQERGADAQPDTAHGEPRPGPDRRWAEPAPGVQAGTGRSLSTGYCRLCHGKFSSRSLRNAFGKVPVVDESSEKQRRMDQVFFTDFQRLVGVAVRQDPALPPFVCKKCHAQFYKCRSVLKAFIQKVNISPAGHPKARGKSSGLQSPLSAAAGGAPPLADLITSSPQCLHDLVIWTHSHAGSCQVTPSLQSVLSSEYCGIIRAVWGCEEGHDYVMNTDSDCSTLLVENALSVKWELSKGTTRCLTGNGLDAGGGAPEPQRDLVRAAASLPAFNSGTPLQVFSPEQQGPEKQDLPPLQDTSGAPSYVESSTGPACSLNGSPGPPGEKLAPPAASDERVKDEFSDLSEG